MNAEHYLSLDLTFQPETASSVRNVSFVYDLSCSSYERTWNTQEDSLPRNLI